MQGCSATEPKTYRNGVEVGFVPPLDRLAVRQISTRFLSQDKRIEIADLRRCGLSLRAIADRLGRAPSTISRVLVAHLDHPSSALRHQIVGRAESLEGGSVASEAGPASASGL